MDSNRGMTKEMVWRDRLWITSPREADRTGTGVIDKWEVGLAFEKYRVF